MKHLVLGGVRSGKSAFAEGVLADFDTPVSYVATSQVWDDSMGERVRKHKDRRPSHWQLIEEPISLGPTLASLSQSGHAVLIECVSLWLSNLLCLEDEARLEREKYAFLNAVESFQGNLIVVSSEVGLGIMPMNELARRFADEVGEFNQALAKLTSRVTLVAAGIPMPLKF